MTSCPDPDILISLGNATEWELEVLRHVGTCGHCQERLEPLAELRQAVTATESPHSGFTDLVMAGLDSPAVATAKLSPSALWSRLIAGVALPMVVTLTCVVALQAGGGLDPMRSAIASLAIGIATAAWHLRPESHSSAAA